MSRGIVIAIDGPAGSGKSTTALLVAARLGFRYLDTGAMYRALTFIGLKKSVLPSDNDRLSAMAREIEINFKMIDGINRIFVDGEEITEQIRTPEVTADVSEVSAHLGVRQAMVARQREMGREESIVVEGRDTTTVVFPDAEVKVYMDADQKQRASRRKLDLDKMGIETSLAELEADINRRDKYDSGRAHSPLTKAADAIVIDTSDLTIEEQVDQVVALAREAVAQK